MNVVEYTGLEQPDHYRNDSGDEEEEAKPEDRADVAASSGFALLLRKPGVTARRAGQYMLDCSGQDASVTHESSFWKLPFSSSRWTAVEKRFQNAGSRTPAIAL